MSGNDYTRDMLNKMYSLKESFENKKRAENNGFTIGTYTPIMLSEEKGDEEDAIAITDDPRFGEMVLTNQIEQFRTSVDGGAEFTEPSNEDVASSPLIFLPKKKNLVFGGIIPALNNLKWQFVLKTNTGDGCFIWCDGFINNENNLKILYKLLGFYENWKAQWQSEAGDLQRMADAIQNRI